MTHNLWLIFNFLDFEPRIVPTHNWVISDKLSVFIPVFLTRLASGAIQAENRTDENRTKMFIFKWKIKGGRPPLETAANMRARFIIMFIRVHSWNIIAA